MIKAHTKTKDNHPDQLKKLKAALNKYANAHVTIGIHSEAGQYTKGSNPPDVVQVALWQEFGTEYIPSRSFIRSTIDENEALINEWREKALEALLHGKSTVPKLLESIGFRIQVLIQNKIKSNVPPPLKNPDAKSRKGLAPVTLIETGLLLRSVTYKVVT